ncbi:MAG: hypothetical protein HOP12_05875, partial [Candidatus Eisenbacteria bacterium]|nr:hypothetical protein [Candidatus Eisenbacteria bacterium]
VRTDRDREARAEYARAIAISPHDPSVWFNLGNLERRASHSDSALAAFHRATRLDSTFAAAYQSEIQTLRELNRMPEALAAYRRWLRANPELHTARLEASRLAESLDRPDEAIEIAREGTLEADHLGESHEIYGMMQAAHGDVRGALKSLRTASKRFRGDAARSDRITRLVGILRRVAPDSLRAVFAQDSVERVADAIRAARAAAAGAARESDGAAR